MGGYNGDFQARTMTKREEVASRILASLVTGIDADPIYGKSRYYEKAVSLSVELANDLLNQCKEIQNRETK